MHRYRKVSWPANKSDYVAVEGWRNPMRIDRIDVFIFLPHPHKSSPKISSPHSVTCHLSSPIITAFYCSSLYLNMMLRRILCTIILALVLVKRDALAQSKGSDERIHGGVEVPLDDAPFQVSFQTRRNHFCGGSIVDQNFIVTAAHCCVAVTTTAPSSDTVEIAAGLNKLSTPEQGFQRITVARMIVHPDYDEHVISAADICMLQLKQPLILSGERRTAAINLPPPGYNASGNANVTGWGRVSDNSRPDTLMRVQIPIVPDNVCREKYGPDRIKDEMICAGATGKGGCYGDSGGPLIDSKGFMVGVVSWGRGCGSGTYPGVYTEVSYFTQWIKNVLANSTLVDSVSS